MAWSLRHRGRAGVDVMQVRIGADLASATVQETISDDRYAWGYYSGFYTVPAGQTNTAFIFEAVSTATGSLSVGNLIDDIQITIADVPICRDTDNDGFPDSLDLDSDNDGCSDANEYYKNENTDGGDDGEYGSGTPNVNADGSVIAAPYAPVFAPEILLGNTSEDLGGTDINGQNVSLGQTFEYVLRFQNTGDDDAINYTIRDILPDNITFDNVDITNAPGTTHNYDLVNNTLNFQIPDNLVENGDPEYSIRISVTIALNCSDFVAACSSTLENKAFSTFQGVLNPLVFTDEGVDSTMAGCPYIPQVASNSILNDLTACNQARTIQLCGDNVLMTAGAGFVSYNWVLDENANGVVDGADTVLNDGDPDGDPSTLLVTTIGEYIVEKTSDGSCPDLIERITVERFGSTQSNPIVSFFNQVNSDANPDNDLQGEIVTCPIDGDLLPKIFLCGAGDEAVIQLGISDAQSIVWEKLDETSCSDAGDDCANKNGTCTWSQVAVNDNFTLVESGKFRVVIIYQNGCFSRFYFDVFKNELAIDHTSSDILCATPGTIRIINIGTGYGFQLIDAITDALLIPFSANNGPNFDIATNGSYRVQVTALNPANGSPIAGACIFETEDIGIIERDFQVNLASTPADCNQLGTVTVQVVNASANYSYELRLDDGTNGGEGSLVNSQPTNTDNTYTFSNVNPENYIIVSRTEDGCFDSQQIVVGDTPELSLSAINSQNISCVSGIATLTPTGGTPDPNYQMAIWSKDGVDLYVNPSDILLADLQTTPNILFRDSIDAGEYEFIVIDSNGCYAISNAIAMQDLGTPLVSASHTAIICADDASSSLTISVTGGTAPYQYSLDGGATYQNTATFVNLTAGLVSITVMDASNNGANGCIGTLEYEIDQPFRLTASATIVEDASCNPAGALVKILNANGGQAPYQYSFDGGTSFGANNDLYLASGDYNFVVRDNLGCAYTMQLTIPSNTVDPIFNNLIDYDCDGLGMLTITPSNTTDFSYSYALNGSDNTPVDSPIFSNISVGTQTVTVGYSSSISPSQTTLIFEDFGAGASTQIGEIGPDYCYEPQDGTTTACNLGPAGILANGEYTVTNVVTNPIPSWRSPNDHTGIADGRFLAIDVSTLAGANGILWARRGIEVLPNQDITISLWAYNLLRTGTAGNNPEVLIELVNSGGTVITSIATAEIPKNNTADDWHNREIILNPGSNTAVDIVFRSNRDSDFGNDLILDDLRVNQLPVVCEKTTDITVVIEANKEFSASLLGTTDPSCNLSSDGAIRFEVSNFDVVTGFEYSTDGGANWITSLVTPVTTSTTLADGAYAIQVRKINNTSCTSTVNATLTQPLAIVPQLIQTADFTCFNTGATLEASATGGTPSYEYQLENTGGTTIAVYQTNTQFTNIADGDYVVRVRDQNNCTIVSTATVTVAPPTALAFDVTPTACYSGINDGSISVNVTTGNGNYEFRIDSGAWTIPTPSTATTYTFENLANGSYTIEVKDGFGCSPTQQTVVLNDQLSATTVLQSDLSCINDASLDVNATGGSGNYTYEWANTNSGPWNTTNFSGNNFTTSTAGTYYFRVTDDTAPTPCSWITSVVTITPAIPPVITGITTTDLRCNGDDSGSLNIAIDSAVGLAPFAFNILNTTTGRDYGIQTSGLAAGDYTVTLTDSKGCFITGTATLNQPELITYNTITVPITCNVGSGATEPGSISINGTTGGTGNYTYQLTANNGITPQFFTTTPTTIDHTFSILTFGIYKVDIIDANGCASFSTEIVASPPDDLDIDVSTTTTSCTDGGTAIIEVSASVGSGNYEFGILEDFNSPYTPNYYAPDTAGGSIITFSNATNGVFLIPGVNYTFVVHDLTTNCYYFESALTPIDSPSNLSTSAVLTENVTCTGGADGNVSFTIEDYDLGATSIDYQLFASQSNIAISTVTNITANPGATAITIANFGSLVPGEYYLLITEQGGPYSGCSVLGAEFSIRESVQLLEIIPFITKNDNCNLNAGEITALGRFGTAPYEYQLVVNGDAAPTRNTWAGSSSNVFNAEGGNYDIYIKDTYNCIQMANIVLPTDVNPEISLAIVDDCVAEGDYEIVVTLDTPSSSPYSLSVNNAAFQNITFTANTYTISGLSSGVAQTVEIKDLNGCGDSLETFTIYPKFQASVTKTKLIDCTASPDATINIQIVDGSGAFEYSITNDAGAPVVPPSVVPSTNFNYQAPVAGNYTITIYDTNTSSSLACDRVFVINVPQKVEPIIDPTIIITNSTCLGDTDGTITISTTNSTAAPYHFEITSIDGATTSILPTQTAGTSATFTGLAPTTTAAGYIVTVTGEAATNNCSVNSASIIVTEPLAITFTPPTLTPFSCTAGNATNNANISINTSSIGGGSGTYVRYEFIDVASGNTLQNGTDSNYVYTDLLGGDVNVLIYDDKGCHGETLVTVPAFDVLISAAVVIYGPISCSDYLEDIRINVTGSITSYDLVDPGNYEFRLLPSGAPQTSNEFSDLPPGNYTIAVRNTTTGCEITTNHSVADPNTFNVSVEKLSDVICYGDTGSVRLLMSDATYVSSFTWSIYNTNGTPADRLDDGPVISTGNSPGFGPTAPINLPAGNYLVEVKQDTSPSCSQVSVFSITTPSAPLGFNPIDLANVGCTNDQGSAAISPTGGLAPYEITLTNNTTSVSSTVTAVNANLFQGLTAGQYTIFITDALGCLNTFTNQFELLLPDAISGNVSATDLLCQGDVNATVTITLDPRNSTADYSYTLNTYSDISSATLLQSSVSQTVSSFTNLGPGFYTISVADDLNCTFESAIVGARC